jgi:hypothetical protein
MISSIVLRPLGEVKALSVEKSLFKVSARLKEPALFKESARTEGATEEVSAEKAVTKPKKRNKLDKCELKKNFITAKFN